MLCKTYVPSSQIGNRKVDALFLLSYINKIQRGKQSFAIAVRFPWRYTIFGIDKIKTNFKFQKYNGEKKLCTEARNKFTNFSQIPHHGEWRYPYIRPLSNHWQTISNLRRIHHSESLANLCHLKHVNITKDFSMNPGKKKPRQLNKNPI